MEYSELISVVIPSYNRKDKLPACLESVLNQTYGNIEVIVVDDASTDGTEELFRDISDPRVKFLRYEENHGACYARNYGAERAQGELIAFQDSDDTWHQDKLEKQYRRLMETGADMCYCGMNRVAANGSRFYYPVHAPRPGCALEDFLAENRASTQTMLMHRCVWAELRFDESIRRYQKHRALYEKYPESDAVMNRRMGKRLHPADPKTAAGHFRKSYRLSHSFYDLAYFIFDTFRAMPVKK